MRSLQNKKQIVQSHLRNISIQLESTFTGTQSSVSAHSRSPQTTPRSGSTPRTQMVRDILLRSAPVRKENVHRQRLGSITGARGFTSYQQQMGKQTDVRQKEPDSEPTTPAKQQESDQYHGQKSKGKVAQNLKLRSKFNLRQSEFSQNNFEIESASADSSEEHEISQDFAQREFGFELNPQKKKEADQFIEIYKREYGMPPSKGDVTNVEDYLFKLLEYKFSSDELSSEDVELPQTDQLKKEIENETQTTTDKVSSSHQINERTSIAFKKLSNKGFLVLKKDGDKCSYKVVFVRHGQSIWNKAGRCSGWIDVPLNETGIQEAHDAGVLLRELGYKFDLSYTSYLSRAYDTNMIILDEMNQTDVELIRAWQLNERHYGALEGQYKKELEKEYGTQQVKLWRQSYDHSPPQLLYDDKYHPRFDQLYAHLSEEEQRKLPKGESLEMVAQRVHPYWQDYIVPHLKQLGQNRTLLFTAHQHVCRGLVKVLTGIDNEALLGLRIPNAAPFVFEFDQNMQPLRNYYVDNEEVEVVDSNKIESKETLFMHGR